MERGSDHFNSKTRKGSFNPLNYRPIALTSCICNTVERMVNERLVWYLEKNVYCVVIGQIDRQLIIKFALRHSLEMFLSTINT